MQKRLLAILLMALCNLASAKGAQVEPHKDISNQPASSSADEVLAGNPIKLNISTDAPLSDRPDLPGAYSLEKAVQVGLAHNLEYEQAESSTKIARFNTRFALGRFGPTFSVNTFYSTSSLNQMLFYPNDGTGVNAPMQPIVKGSSFSLIFAGNQPLFTGGYLRGNYRAAKALEKQSLANYQASRISTALKIKESYWQAIWTEAQLRVDSDYVKFRADSLANMKKRVEEGKAPRADYLRYEAELSRARKQVNEDYRNFNTALINLKTVMGVNIASLIDVSDTLQYVETSGDLASYMRQANINRPEIAQARSRIEEMRGKHMMARSAYAPHVDLYGLGSNITGTSPDGTADGRWGGFVSVIGHYTLFDSGQRAAQLGSAREAIHQAELALQQAQLKVTQEVSTAWVDLDLTRRNIELAKSEIQSGEEDYRLLHTRYLIGKSIALEEFDAAIKLFRARLSLVESIYNYRLAQSRLAYASGTI